MRGLASLSIALPLDSLSHCTFRNLTPQIIFFPLSLNLSWALPNPSISHRLGLPYNSITDTGSAGCYEYCNSHFIRAPQPPFFEVCVCVIRTLPWCSSSEAKCNIFPCFLRPFLFSTRYTMRTNNHMMNSPFLHPPPKKGSFYFSLFLFLVSSLWFSQHLINQQN